MIFWLTEVNDIIQFLMHKQSGGRHCEMSVAYSGPSQKSLAKLLRNSTRLKASSYTFNRVLNTPLRTGWYRPEDIVKYCHLSPSGNRALAYWEINKCNRIKSINALIPRVFFTLKQTDKIILKEYTQSLQENRFSLLEIWKKNKKKNQSCAYCR